MPPQRGPQFSYSYSQMEAAINAVQNRGLGKKTAAKMYNVPRSTLQDKIAGRTPLGRKMGKDPYLSRDQEQQIAEYVF